MSQACTCVTSEACAPCIQPRSKGWRASLSQHLDVCLHSCFRGFTRKRLLHVMTCSPLILQSQDDVWAQLLCQLANHSSSPQSSTAGQLSALPLQAAARTLLQPGSLCLQSTAAVLRHCGQAGCAVAELKGLSLAELRSRVSQVLCMCMSGGRHVSWAHAPLGV